MRRREFVGLIGGAAAWPLVARAQRTRLIGFLHNSFAAPLVARVVNFHQGLATTGFMEGETVSTVYRWAEGEYNRLPMLAQDLVTRRVSVIAALGGTATAKAAKEATQNIPVVFTVGDDPVRYGLVRSLNEPGENVTGVSLFTSSLGSKRLELLRELLPSAKSAGLLINQLNARAVADVRDMSEIMSGSGIDLVILSVTTNQDIEKAFADAKRREVDVILLNTDSLLLAYRDQLIGLAANHRIPMISYSREFTEAGGLMSYGSSLAEAYRQAGVYVGMILKGEKPANLPVMQPTTLELVINAKAARELNLTIPPSLLARADEVIE